MGTARATTPTVILKFKEPTLDLTQMNNVYVTFKQGMKNLTKSGADIEVHDKQIDIYLNQAETLRFAVGEVKVQANWTTFGGRRGGSVVGMFELTEQLLEKVIT